MVERRQFTPAYKAQIVLEILTEGKSLSAARRDYGIKDSVLSRWKQALIERSPMVFENQASINNHEEQIAELERMVGRLAAELEIQKKATAVLKGGA
jgi:transposase-like protein